MKMSTFLQRNGSVDSEMCKCRRKDCLTYSNVQLPINKTYILKKMQKLESDLEAN